MPSPSIEEQKVRCLLLLPSGDEFDPLRKSLRAAGTDEGIQIVQADAQNKLFSTSETRWIFSALRRAAFVVVHGSVQDRNTLLAAGAAQALGKPIVCLVPEGAVETLMFEQALYMSFESSGQGLTELRTRFRKFIRDFRRFPEKYRPTGVQNSAQAPVVDLDRLEPREFENLCFELLSQMGYRRVEWAVALREVDLVATFPKKDPDGFEYQELWLISMGLHAPLEALVEVVAMEPEYVLSRMLSSSESQERSRTGFAVDMPATILFIPLNNDQSVEHLRRIINKAERRFRERRHGITLRFRIWDRPHLANLIRQYPQIVYKYFSEERSQSKYRKSSEELYKENVTLTETLQTTLDALEEERGKRTRAERDAIWKELSFTAAHKLGNPIFALETDLQGIKKRIRERRDDALDVAGEMGTSLEKAKTIVEQFKSLTKAQEMSPRSVDIVPLIQNAARVAENNGIKLQLKIPSQLPKLMVDPDRISESFDELVANSMRWFTKTEKQLTISVDLPKARELPRILKGNARYLRIRFEDNGCGIATDSKEKIFEPFFTTHPHGTGLGLALVQRVIEGHRGLIREIGKTEDGAAFEIYLPIPSGKLE